LTLTICRTTWRISTSSDIMSIMDAAEAQELYELAETGRAAARTHQPDAEKPVEERYPNVVAALQWHLDRGEIEAGFRFANALVTFWLGTNRIPDGDDWLGRLLDAPGEAGTTRALALHEHGYLVFWAGEHDRAAARFRQSLDLAASLNDASLQALALAGLARVALYTDPAEAVRLLREALDLTRDLPDDDPGRSSAVHVLGPALQMSGDLEGAREVIGQRLATAQRQGVAFIVWSESANLSMVERQLGNLDRAEELSRQAIETATAREHDLYLAWTLNGLAAVTAAKGESLRSATLLGAATSLLQRAGGEWPPDEREQYEETDASLRQAAAPDELAHARAQGAAMTRKQAVAYALS
jgi:tetratricopeptide (TPR) repeat protein